MNDVSVLETFREQIADWTERRLRPYLTDLEDRPAKSRPRAKEFNDAVWTTVVLRPIEVVVLDSPLLQRLRHIRQLGVVHLVYPSATHTRLDHSIGTVHQLVALFDGINGQERLIEPKFETLLRLAALCHDIGHGVMSHVSENAMINYVCTRRLMKAFGGHTGREKRKLSEVAAWCMIGSPAFTELLEQAERISAEPNLPPDAAALMQKAIVGSPISSEVPLLHELISGPFDADKLDYMTRDARMTGVPVVTDIPRLVQKVRGQRIATADLPKEIKSGVSRETTTCVMTGVALSGGRTLDELMFGQTLLFDKLYRHQKVRACEAMVAAIFDRIGDLCAAGALMAPFELLDADLLMLDMARIERFAGRPLTDARERHDAEVAIDISRRLYERCLFRRAFAFAHNMPQDPYHNETQHYQGLVRLTRMARNPTSRESLVHALVETVEQILRDLGKEDIRAKFPGGDISPYIRLDPPNAQTQNNDTARAYLIGDGASGPPAIPFRDEYAETAGWSNAYLLTRDTGYIFAAEELALPVYLAAEKLVRIDYGVRTPSSMRTYAKQDGTKLDQAKHQLDQAGFYRSAPYDLRPLPPSFATAEVLDRLTEVKEALREYHGPVRDGQEHKRATIMSEARIEAFSRQFGSTHAEAALTMLQRLSLIGRMEIVAALKEFLKEHESADFISAVPLGDAKDSSAITTYYAGDAKPLRARGLGDALLHEGGIVFAEDFVGTGAQTISLLENLLGVEPTTNLGEQREQSLSPELRELLRARELAVVYAAGRRAGAENVRKAADRLELKLTVHLHRELAPTAFDGDSEFRERCREIGRSLLTDGNELHNDAWIEERVLGYGNEAFMVVFPYNTPTQTLTCLWKAGTVDGIEWVPLIPRRPKF